MRNRQMRFQAFADYVRLVGYTRSEESEGKLLFAFTVKEEFAGRFESAANLGQIRISFIMQARLQDSTLPQT